MGLINVPDIQDGDQGSAELWNSRFGTIVDLLNGNLDGDNFADGAITIPKVATEVFQKIYPIGSVYINATDNTNPSTLLGFGTWVAFGAGRVPVGFDSGDTDFNAAEKTGGGKTQTLAAANLPNVQGTLSLHGGEGGSMFAGVSGVFAKRADLRSGYKTIGTTGGSQSQYYGVHFDLNGGTQTGYNVLQSYITVYMWKRTA